MTLDTLLDKILHIEGWPKYTNDPADQGGPTKGGITLKTLEGFLGRKCSEEELRNLKEDIARNIYTQLYITDWNFHHIEDEWVWQFVIDTGVLSGQERAAKMLQRVVGVDQDGDIGPTTLATLDMMIKRNRKTFCLSLVRERQHMLLDAIVVGVPKELRTTTNLKWRHGWWNRVADFIDLI